MKPGLDDLRRFYGIIDRLAANQSGPLKLASCLRNAVPASRGVYFFFERGEMRSASGAGSRVVRVGTHALGLGARSTLWSRLAQHRGSPTSGNQRGSIFRRHVGLALMAAGRTPMVEGWRIGRSSTPEQRAAERDAEILVSQTIGAMSFLWLDVPDEPGPLSDRGYIERNAIALLSSATVRTGDAPSPDWLGQHASAAEIRASGLWNVQHVGKAVDADFLDRFDGLVMRVA
ncbi:MAG: hypothetical protein K2X46_09615 [Roseomonas sp.]|nr:hypothetical protein [Roseomonas sp.]